MKFLVDAPLGGLAKWLRFLGFDAADVRLPKGQPRSLPPSQPETYILTRQASLARAGRPDLLVIAANDPDAQLEEVLRRLKITRRQVDLLSRCSRCNEKLAPVARDRVLGRVPEHVFFSQEQFYECPRCQRIFWPGSHLRGISQRLLKRLEEPALES